MTDRTIARLAWMAFGVITLLLLAVLGASYLNWAGNKPAGWDMSGDVLALVMFSFPVAAVFIAPRRPRNPIVWILLAIGFFWEVDGLTSAYVTSALVTNPGSLPRPDLVLALSEWLWVPSIGLMGTYLILLFPDGRLPSPRWKPVGWISAIVLILSSVGVIVTPGDFAEGGFPDIANPLGIEALSSVLPVLYMVILLIPLCIVACAGSVIQRYRRSRGLERLQLKWLAAGAGTAAVAYLIAMIVSIPYDWGGTAPLWVTGIQNVALFSFVLIPVAVGIAILQHGLYDIDRIINRTLVYGAVTALLALVYAGGVFAVGGAVRSMTDQESNNIAVAATTLAVAALFQPVRVRMQAFVDRRFYRRKYDAARTLEDFSVRMRDEVDLDALNTQLVAVVNQALQPAHVTLWIKPPDVD